MQEIIHHILSDIRNYDLSISYSFISLLAILTLFGFGVGYIFGFVRRLFDVSSNN
ncbi:MAG: hypothetical protein J6569_04665 [Gilliamella sp.]|uniref:hypothetical protein n=1 Tax=Gilliamella sp. TaxID=1891236 RepID=UPI0025DAF5CC|nr:hypothetical protein [Gilliamella sp.]MCO6539412.1 hypothetical protein [Gilliamella sp.]